MAGEIDNSTNIVEDFNISLPVIDSVSSKKSAKI